MRWSDNRALAATVGHGWIRRASIVLAMIGAGSTAHAGVPTETETAKLVPTDGMAQDQVGKSVAIEDETLVLGAPNYFADPNGPSSLYVFVRGEAGQWEQFDRLFASDGVLGDALGESVAISIDTIIGGAPFKDDNGDFTGAAYVFVRDGQGQWSEQAVIVPDDAVEGDRFGTAVALQGDTAVITAPSSGGTYVYERNDVGLWSQLIKLPDIGSSVAMQGDTLVIGRPDSNDPEAYVYVRDEARGWTQQVVLTPSDAPLTDFFGRSVAIDGDVILVGATHDGIPGAVSVFTRSEADVWTELDPFPWTPRSATLLARSHPWTSQMVHAGSDDPSPMNSRPKQRGCAERVLPSAVVAPADRVLVEEAPMVEVLATSMEQHGGHLSVVYRRTPLLAGRFKCRPVCSAAMSPS